MANPREFSHNDYAVALVCALSNEMAAVRSALDVIHEKLPQSAADDNTYLFGEMSGHEIVIIGLPAGDYGTNSASNRVSQMRSTFPAIRFGLLVGIGGGVPTSENDLRLGDVVTSKLTRTFGGVVQYDFGKAIGGGGGGFERLGALNRPPDVALTAVAQLHSAYLAGHGRISHIISDILCKNPQLRARFSRSDLEEYRLFESTYDHPSMDSSTCTFCDKGKLVSRMPRASDVPQIHYGLIASGNVVIKNGRTRDRLAQSLGNICSEMEAAGVMNIIPTLVIRGICDCSDSHKNDLWQGYAALTAAAYAKELLSIIPMDETATGPHETNSTEVACQTLDKIQQNMDRRGRSGSNTQDVVRSRMQATHYKLLGRLSVDITEVTHHEPVDRKFKKYNVTFLPPSWLSNTTILVNVQNWIQHMHAKPILNWTIQPVSVNQSPQLIDALSWRDIYLLKDLFSAKKARPTDMVFDELLNEPVPLLEAILRAFTDLVPCSSKLLRHKLVFQFLLDQNQCPSPQSIVSFFLSADDDWVYDQRRLLQNLLHNYLRSVLALGYCSLEPVKIPKRQYSVLCALVENVLGFEAVYTCLFHQSQAWTIEELTGRSIWYIGVLAHTDETFRAALENYFSSFISPFSTSSKAKSKNHEMLRFEIKSIVEQVKTAPLQERNVFLQTIILRGTASMLEPVLNVSIDLNKGYIMENYLGIAAALGRLPIVASLLGSGASTARALPLLCQSQGLEITVFNSLFSKFIDSLDGVANTITVIEFPDPVVSVLQCKRGMAVRPDAVEVSLRAGAFLPSLLYGSQDIYIPHSYVLNAILYDQPTSLESFLELGVLSDTAIQDIFSTDREWFMSVGSYTWLTLAVELGKTACVKVLVEKSNHPSYLVSQRDAAGRRAISLAQSHAARAHPRFSDLYHMHWINERSEISLSDDTAVLEILKAVLDTGTEHPEATDPNSSRNVISLSRIKGMKWDIQSIKRFEMSIYEAFYIFLCFIGMYGLFIGYLLLQFALDLKPRRHILRALLLLCLTTLLSLIHRLF